MKLRSRLLHLPRRVVADDERGAVLVMAAAGVVVAVLAAALSVDIGSMAATKREVRKVADLAALDAVQVIEHDLTALPDPSDPLGLATLSPSEETQRLAEESAAKNGFPVDDDDPETVLVATLGNWADEEFTACADDPLVADLMILAGTCDPDAVHVAATDRAPKYFAIFQDGERYVTGEAVAAMVDEVATRVEEIIHEEEDTLPVPGGRQAAVTIGSFAARVDTASSPLLDRMMAAMIGGDPNLRADAVGYRGLADGEVTLRKLAAELTAGDVDALLTTEVTFRQLVDATATALDNDEPTTADIRTRLAKLSTAATTTAAFQLGEILSFAAGNPDVVGEAEWNVVDIVTGGAQAINEGNFVTLSLDGSTGGDFGVIGFINSKFPGGHLETVTLRMHIIEPAKTVIGGVGSTVESAQIRLAASAELVDDLNIRNLLGSLVGTSEVRVPLYVDAASAQATIADLACDGTDPLGVGIKGVAGVVRAGIAEANDSELAAGVYPRRGRLVNALLLLQADGSSGMTLEPAGAEENLTFVPAFDPSNPLYTQTIAAAHPTDFSSRAPKLDPLDDNLAVTLTPVPGLSLHASVRTDLVGIVNRAVPTLNSLVDLVAGGLGVAVGGADITVPGEQCQPDIPGTTGTTMVEVVEHVERTGGRLPVLVD